MSGPDTEPPAAMTGREAVMAIRAYHAPTVLTVNDIVRLALEGASGTRPMILRPSVVRQVLRKVSR